MTITAKNIGRINVWPTYALAREADTEESKFIGQLTVWQTNDEARANTSHEEEGGGGGAPDWVPANAVIHIDLVGGDPQGRAWVADTGEVAVDTLLGNDPNADSGWGTTAWHEEYLVADHGYRLPPQVATPDRFVAFIGAARTRILSGSTVCFRIVDLLPDELSKFVCVSASGGASVECQIVGLAGINAQKQLVFSGGGELFSAILNSVNTGSGSINGTAFTITPIRFDHAINGLTAQENIMTEDDFPTSGDDQIVAALLQLDYEHPAIQSITFYDPLPSISGLSELSNTGVVNTAPYEIEAVWEATILVSGSGTTGTVIQDLGAGEVGLLTVLATDDEGNPLIYSLSDDESGAFIMSTEVGDVNPHGVSIADLSTLGLGAHDFTVRATDPGGLYVEQEFTITVTV